MPAATFLFSFALLLLGVLRDRRLLGSRLPLALVAWALSAGAVAVRANMEGQGIGEILFWLSGMNFLVLLCSLGRPALLMTDLFENEYGESELPKKLRRRGRIGQVLYISGVIIAVVIFTD
ncbi:hypothetical protein [Actinopolymorpha alba]|uniref:hypothetical protein n=1 Tax=Actinopolymorpha alba TaxID=533267 RepID=UPI0012F6AB4A|nr:hypothetical protein [Actinopolymorpha alba]